MGNQENEQRWGTLAEVAKAYEVSVDTIRRRIRRGELEGRRQQTPSGFKWLALLPPETPSPSEGPQEAAESPQSTGTVPSGVTIVQQDQEELITTLRQELALRNREIARLHEVLATQAQSIAHVTAALPVMAPSPDSPTPDLGPSAVQPIVQDETLAEPLWGRIKRWLAGE